MRLLMVLAGFLVGGCTFKIGSDLWRARFESNLVRFDAGTKLTKRVIFGSLDELAARRGQAYEVWSASRSKVLRVELGPDSFYNSDVRVESPDGQVLWRASRRLVDLLMPSLVVDAHLFFVFDDGRVAVVRHASVVVSSGAGYTGSGRIVVANFGAVERSIACDSLGISGNNMPEDDMRVPSSEGDLAVLVDFARRLMIVERGGHREHIYDIGTGQALADIPYPRNSLVGLAAAIGLLAAAGLGRFRRSLGIRSPIVVQEAE